MALVSGPRPNELRVQGPKREANHTVNIMMSSMPCHSHFGNAALTHCTLNHLSKLARRASQTNRYRFRISDSVKLEVRISRRGSPGYSFTSSSWPCCAQHLRYKPCSTPRLCPFRRDKRCIFVEIVRTQMARPLPRARRAGAHQHLLPMQSPLKLGLDGRDQHTPFDDPSTPVRARSTPCRIAGLSALRWPPTPTHQPTRAPPSLCSKTRAQSPLRATIMLRTRPSSSSSTFSPHSSTSGSPSPSQVTSGPERGSRGRHLGRPAPAPVSSAPGFDSFGCYHSPLGSMRRAARHSSPFQSPPTLCHVPLAPTSSTTPLRHAASGSPFGRFTPSSVAPPRSHLLPLSTPHADQAHVLYLADAPPSSTPHALSPEERYAAPAPHPADHSSPAPQPSAHASSAPEPPQQPAVTAVSAREEDAAPERSETWPSAGGGGLEGAAGVPASREVRGGTYTVDKAVDSELLSRWDPESGIGPDHGDVGPSGRYCGHCYLWQQPRVKVTGGWADKAKSPAPCECRRGCAAEWTMGTICHNTRVC